MAFPFSFFSSDSFPEAIVASGDAEEEVGPLPPADVLPPVMVKPDPGTAAVPTGLAALAVQQSTGIAPPTRKLAPGKALAAGLALAAPVAGEMQVPPAATPAPPSAHLNAAPYTVGGRELEHLRADMERQMEQLRQDVFGAAMGVSALKDRLDSLETCVRQEQAALAESQGRVAAVVQEWSETHMPVLAAQAVESTLERALQQTVAVFTSHEFFRMPVPSVRLSAEMFLSQPPHILSASRS